MSCVSKLWKLNSTIGDSLGLQVEFEGDILIQIEAVLQCALKDTAKKPFCKTSSTSAPQQKQQLPRDPQIVALSAEILSYQLPANSRLFASMLFRKKIKNSQIIPSNITNTIPRHRNAFFA